MESINNYIGGEFVAPTSGADRNNPAIQQSAKFIRACPTRMSVMCSSPRRQRRGHFRRGPATPAGERARILRRIGTLIRERQEELARIESVDTGKPLSAAMSLDIPRSALNFEFFADAIHAVFQRVSQHGQDRTQLHPAHTFGCGGLHFALGTFRSIS